MDSGEDTHYRLLKQLTKNPSASQRSLADSIGVSVGKINYCLRALVQKGWVKARNFRRSDNKLAYAYVLTPSGIEMKAEMTRRFLRMKMAEFELIQREIEELTLEAHHAAAEPEPTAAPEDTTAGPRP